MTANIVKLSREIPT